MLDLTPDRDLVLPALDHFYEYTERREATTAHRAPDLVYVHRRTLGHLVALRRVLDDAATLTTPEAATLLRALVSEGRYRFSRGDLPAARRIAELTARLAHDFGLPPNRRYRLPE